MRYEKNHGHYEGRLIREGNFIRRVTWTFWHWYGVEKYSTAILSESNKNWERPLPLTAEKLIRLGIVTR